MDLGFGWLRRACLAGCALWTAAGCTQDFSVFDEGAAPGTSGTTSGTGTSSTSGGGGSGGLGGLGGSGTGSSGGSGEGGGTGGSGTGGSTGSGGSQEGGGGAATTTTTTTTTTTNTTTTTTTTSSSGGPCGNGALDPGEACDDGDDAPGDGCSPGCEWEDDAAGCPSGGTFVLDSAGLWLAGDNGDGQNVGGSQCGGNSAPDLVFRISPSVSGTVSVELTALAGDDLVIDAREGCVGYGSHFCCNAEPACGDTLDVSAGEPFHLFVSGISGDTGPFTLHLSYP